MKSAKDKAVFIAKCFAPIAAAGFGYVSLFGMRNPVDMAIDFDKSTHVPNPELAIDPEIYKSPAVKTVEEVHPEASGYRVYREMPNMPGANRRVLAFDIGVVPCQIELDQSIGLDITSQQIAPGAQIICM